MIGSDYRSAVNTFFPLTPRIEAHSTHLTEKKDSRDHTEMNQVRGHSSSTIEKMTHPLAQPDDKDHFSPYMIDLLGRTRTLAFAEKALQAPRKRLLDTLGIDDTQHRSREIRLYSDQTAISRFYSYAVQPVALTLNGRPFLEQEPTNPYFQGQKIITPDPRICRSEEKSRKLDLLRCKSRDDSEIAFNKAPIERLQQYNNTVFLNETRRREKEDLSNKATYFTEMAEFLIQRAKPGDFIVQNALESSNDKNTPHFQFIPDQVPLPIFSRTPPHTDNPNPQILDWHLPSMCETVDLQHADWREKIAQLQATCQQLLTDQHISTTPLFRMMEDDQIKVYLVFKKDCSSVWNMTPEDTQLSPGWLEACGVFITDSPKSEAFNNNGAQNYYATHSVSTAQITTFFESTN
jgi:hypothetical protein